MENLHFVIWFRDYESRYRVTNAAEEVQPVTVDHSNLGNRPGSSSASLDSALEETTSPIEAEDNFRKEVDNILATFFVPNARKELLLSAELRDQVIISAKQSTDPELVRETHSATISNADTAV